VVGRVVAVCSFEVDYSGTQVQILPPTKGYGESETIKHEVHVFSLSWSTRSTSHCSIISTLLEIL
jgi:hypothetical protein